jgi:hypothetical protein
VMGKMAVERIVALILIQLCSPRLPGVKCLVAPQLQNINWRTWVMVVLLLLISKFAHPHC